MAFSRAFPGRDRLGRIVSTFCFVTQLNQAQPVSAGAAMLSALAGQAGGPAVVLAALLLAIGERARVECTRELAFVRVEIGPHEVARLPPYAQPLQLRGRTYLGLDPSHHGRPPGFLPRSVREALARRRCA